MMGGYQPSQDLQQFPHTVKRVGLEYEGQKHIVDLLANECSQAEKLPVDTVKNGL